MGQSAGRVTAWSGVSTQGQGLETTLAQVAADELGVTPEDVTVTVQAWDGGAFTARDAQRYRREGETWRLEKGVTKGASAESAAVA